MLLAPCGELPNILDRGEIRTNALIGLEHHAGNIFGAKTFLFQSGQEQIEARVLGPIAVWKGDLNDGRIFVYNPRLLSRDPAGLLGPECSAMKSALSVEKQPQRSQRSQR